MSEKKQTQMSFVRSLPHRGSMYPVAILLLAGFSSGCGPFGGTAPDSAESAIKRSGCMSSTPTHVAPGGYYVNGNTICTAEGRPHLFHGVDRPSLEWSPTGSQLNSRDFQLMGKTWNANIVRIALNQDYWLSASPSYSEKYAPLVDQVIGWAEAAGMDVILDLHWNDTGIDLTCRGSGCPVLKPAQQLMADTNSRTFWSEVAARYKDDGRVLFELYNEPHDVDSSIWRDGGATSQGWTAVGMQELYNTVRQAGADNLVIAGGLSFAYDLSFVGSNKLDGYNILYATHPYASSPDKQPSSWEGAWGYLASTAPVIVTEFGDNRAGKCDGQFNSNLIEFARTHFASWTAWAWYAGVDVCNFPSILADWTGNPSEPGQPVKDALQQLNPGDPPASMSVRDAGGDGAVLNLDGGMDEGGQGVDGSTESGADDAASSDGAATGSEGGSDDGSAPEAAPIDAAPSEAAPSDDAPSDDAQGVAL